MNKKVVEEKINKKEEKPVDTTSSGFENVPLFIPNTNLPGEGPGGVGDNPFFPRA